MVVVSKYAKRYPKGGVCYPNFQWSFWAFTLWNWRVGLKYPLAGPSGHCYCSSLLQKFPFFLYFFKCTFFTTIILHWSSIQRGLLWKSRYYVTDLLCNGSKNQMERKVFAWNRNWPMKNGILLPKLFWPPVRKKMSYWLRLIHLSFSPFTYVTKVGFIYIFWYSFSFSSSML